MQLDEFLYNLHFDIDKVRPLDAAIDWADAPLPFKLYQNLPTVALSPETPLNLSATSYRRNPRVNLKDIGDFAWYSYGLTQLCHAMLPFDEGDDGPKIMQLLRRYVPSGGGLYPSELYAYLKIDDVIPGIYHYDVAHHRFVLLREGDFDAYLERALGHRCSLESCFGVLFVSTVFWKNFYKYKNFAYRLQALDAGALIGQLIDVARQYGYASYVPFQFLDKSVNHLLGLCDKEESVYAVIPLALAGPSVSILRSDVRATDGMEHAETLCTEIVNLEHRHYVKSQRIEDYSLLIQMNEASMRHSTQSFTYLPSEIGQLHGGVGEITPLPTVQAPDDEFATACRHRFSPALDFVPKQMSLGNLSALLKETTERSAYANDLRAVARTSESAPDIDIALCSHGIDGLHDGAYLYDGKVHGLRLLHAGDHRMELQQAMTMPTVNLFQTPVCFHLIGSRDFHFDHFGYRGYRIRQMEVGMLLQHLLLSASALGMAGHPLLGYDESVCDNIYNFSSNGRTCLIQIPVGFYRKKVRFDGPLHG